LATINKITMQGFKSFAKKTEIILTNDFNCVLGPNGSGKSNILDAICFVLGKKSSKSLRAEKSANLIYNGGKKKQPAKEANVTIYFNNKNSVFPIEGNEVKLSRIVRQTGNSIYKINDKTVTRNQVTELLSHARVNPNGYNIVLQGDIIRIVEMTPLDRRKIIEEIAGISIYEDKKQKAINELNKVEEKLKEADIILAERHTYLRELKKERNQALKFKELDEKIKRNKATVLHLKISKKDKRKQQFEKDMGSKKNSIKKFESQIQDLKNQIGKTKEEINEINKDIEEKGDKDQVRIQKLIEELRVSIGTNKSRINSVENELTRISERKAQLQQSYDDLKDKISRLETEKKGFDNSINEKQEQINQIEAKISGFKSKHELADSADLEKEIEEIDRSAEEKLVNIQELREKQQELMREKDRFEYQIEGADEKISKVLEVQKEHKKELDRLKIIRQDFKKATLELNTRLNEDSATVAQLTNARSSLLKLREDLARINAKQAGITAKLTGNMAVQKILELKRKLKGIYGTVSSLGEVSSEHATALEVAAGPRIKSVVVDNDETAAECIKYLKNNRLGRATFLPLNKIKPTTIKPELNQISNQPGVVGKAIDLVKYDSKYKNIFSYVFGNTIVVDNIDTARTVGIGRFRMATLEGDLTEVSGAMHGGFRRKEHAGGFIEKEVMSQLKDLEAKEKDAESVVRNLEKKKVENEEFINKLRHEKAELEAEIIKIEKSLHLEDSDLDITKGQKKDLADNVEKLDIELRTLLTEITQSNSQLAEIKSRKLGLREKINALKNPALIAELNTFEQKKTELKEDIIRANSETKNMDVQISTILQPELNNTKKILKQHDKEDDEFNTEIKNVKELIKNEEKELVDKESTQKEFYAKYKSLFKKRDGINDNLNEHETKLYKKEDGRRNEELKLNAISLDNAKVTAELEGLNVEYKEYEGVPVFKDKDEEKIKREIWEFEKMVRDIGLVNMRALEIYDQVEKEYKNVIEKKTTLSTEREDVLLMMNEIETKKKDLFMTTFDAINENFKQKFSTLSTKGEATLKLEEPETVFEGGMNIKVRLVGKKFLDIRSLSGGEKTMTALAFLFAVQDHEPAPFYVLDEVDAALDKRNSETLANLIKSYIDKAQYLVISHNDTIISEADNLYGVSMNEHGISKIVSLRI